MPTGYLRIGKFHIFTYDKESAAKILKIVIVLLIAGLGCYLAFIMQKLSWLARNGYVGIAFWKYGIAFAYSFSSK